MSNLNKPFLYVNDENLSYFTNKHINYEVEVFGETDKYDDRIVFLGSTGKIFSHGKIYGDNEVYIGDLESAPADAKIVISNETDTSIEVYSKDEVYSKSEINTKLSDIYVKSDVYTKTEVDSQLTDMYTKSDVYTKTEVDALFDEYTPEETSTSSGNKYVIGGEDDSFNFSDKDGHVVAKIDANGIKAVGFYDADGNELTYASSSASTSSTSKNRFTNKYVFSLCDSLGSGGGWQTAFCTAVSAKPFNQELNGGATLKAQGLTLSCGGAATLHRMTFGWNGRPDGLISGQQRAINFVKQSENLYGSKDFLFLQNINDFNFFGDECTDEMIADPSIVDPVMVEETYIYDGQIFSTQIGAREYFYANLSTVLSGITPAVNRAITLKCGSKKFKFTIANAATQDGTVTITINGQEYVEQVLSGTSVADIATQLYAINFVGYDNSKTDDVLSITANTVAATDYTVTVTNTCGCGITVAQESATGNWSAVFTSHDVNDWLDTTKWETNVTSMRAIMGLIEYLEQKLPKTHLIYVLMPRFPFKYDAYQKADGTPDEHTYKNIEIVKRFERFLKMQKAVCEFYNLEYIDLAHTMGWNYNNMYTWFGAGTIHWNAYAHEYIGEFLANKLT